MNRLKIYTGGRNGQWRLGGCRFRKCLWLRIQDVKDYWQHHPWLLWWRDISPGSCTGCADATRDTQHFITSTSLRPNV